MLYITDPGVLNSVQPGAPDIRFTDEDSATLLAYEVVSWDTEENRAEVWVRIPQVDGDSDQDFITFWYDDQEDGSVDFGDSPGEVWRDYAAVWHFEESGIALDSTANNNHGQMIGSVGERDGLVGSGAWFRRNAAYEVPYNSTLDETGQSFSVETWYRSNTCAFGIITSKPSLNLVSRDAGSSSWSLSSGRYLSSLLILGSKVERASFRQRNERYSSHHMAGGYDRADLNSTCEEHVVVTYDPNSGSKIYINGTLREESDRRLFTEQGQPIIIGGHDTYYELLMDETRIASQQLSADKIKLQFYSLSQPNRFIQPR